MSKVALEVAEMMAAVAPCYRTQRALDMHSCSWCIYSYYWDFCDSSRHALTLQCPSFAATFDSRSAFGYFLASVHSDS